MQTSSSRRETTPEYRQKPPTGCISGILRLLSRRHSRKRLTSARKKEKIAAAPPVKPTPETETKEEKKSLGNTSTPEPEKAEEKKTLALLAIGEPRRRSCETPRSPTIPQEIRRSSADSPRRSSALVARLMGLDDAPTSSPEPASEKRRKLLGALERCDEDLKTLKRIIEAVQLAEVRRKEIDAVGPAEESGRVKDRCHLDGGDLRVEAGTIGSRTPEPSPLGVSSQSGDCDSIKKKDNSDGYLFFRRIAVEGLPRLSGIQGDRSFQQNGMSMRRKEGGTIPWLRKNRGPRARNKTMEESVGEVWEDGVWEERWELGRIGVGLEIDIFGDLVEELVREMVGCYKLLSLPLRNCRKRLCF
ncbi:hypothetical protein J5N97_014479 [Dioscorea zingiberensis]|uniref:DUF3741 domain-containing protein n=1 Tax=Dioscorea zingiberensis TaxID=325984 RepID=A0A9D5HJJ3_9LILI|nr:hypothetical protein J5N97_014479 [Dioscorea zingiberensis]